MPAASAALKGPNQIVIVGNYRLGIGGDLIVEIDGEPVVDNKVLPRIMNKKHGGDILTLGVLRGAEAKG